MIAFHFASFLLLHTKRLGFRTPMVGTSELLATTPSHCISLGIGQASRAKHALNHDIKGCEHREPLSAKGSYDQQKQNVEREFTHCKQVFQICILFFKMFCPSFLSAKGDALVAAWTCSQTLFGSFLPEIRCSNQSQ